jgi:hypothetical protein
MVSERIEITTGGLDSAIVVVGIEVMALVPKTTLKLFAPIETGELVI